VTITIEVKRDDAMEYVLISATAVLGNGRVSVSQQRLVSQAELRAARFPADMLEVDLCILAQQFFHHLAPLAIKELEVTQ
jgi:hypothetical protein